MQVCSRLCTCTSGNALGRWHLPAHNGADQLHHFTQFPSRAVNDVPPLIVTLDVALVNLLLVFKQIVIPSSLPPWQRDMVLPTKSKGQNCMVQAHCAVAMPQL